MSPPPPPVASRPRVIGRTTTTADQSDPVLVICALAWKGNPLAGDDATEGYVRRVLNSTFAAHSRDEILSWRSRVPPPEHRIRWSAARRWAVRVLAVPGAEHLPEDPSPAEARC